MAHMTTSGELLEAAIAKQIKVELVERGLDQKGLAEMVGVHAVTMSKYIKGTRSMPMPTFFAVAEALGLSPQELMRRAESRIQR